jgi:hypothetical protein
VPLLGPALTRGPNYAFVGPIGCGAWKQIAPTATKRQGRPVCNLVTGKTTASMYGPLAAITQGPTAGLRPFVGDRSCGECQISLIVMT